jgi:opacity protein-like surface antigen
MTDSRKPMVSVLALALLVLGGGFVKAEAQQPPPPPQQQPSLFFDERAWEITPFIGIAFGGGLDTTPATGGVAVGYGGRGWGFEGEIARLKAEQGVPTPFEFTTWTVMVNGTYGFEREGFTPYGLFGVGFQRVNADLSDVPGEFPDDSATEFAWNIGVGLKSMLTHRAGLRADARYVSGRNLAPNFVRLYGGFIWRIGVQ